MAIPNRIRERIAAGTKRLVPVIVQQRVRDVSEADTVTVVKDVLSEMFGYDKHSELTSEHSIRGTYCDLAIKLNDKLALLGGGHDSRRSARQAGHRLRVEPRSRMGHLDERIPVAALPRDLREADRQAAGP